MPATRALAERAQERLDLDGLDFGAFADRPLDADDLRCLRYMHDIEHHTVCYLRDVLVTDSHRDPEITDFMTFWLFQEHWHGEAIGGVLEAHGEAGSAARVPALRASLSWRDRLLPLSTFVANGFTRHLPAVHMAWGAVNEWTTQAAYARLAARCGHPVLAELLQRIMRQEGTHIAFYAGQARRRLADSEAARRLTRFALRHLWSPVGAGVMPEAEVAHLATHLFGGVEGRAATERVDRRIEGLPGLGGLHLLTSAASRYPVGWSAALT